MVPGQIVVAEAASVPDGGGKTVIAIEFRVALHPLAAVITTVTIAELDKVALLNVFDEPDCMDVPLTLKL